MWEVIAIKLFTAETVDPERVRTGCKFYRVCSSGSEGEAEATQSRVYYLPNQSMNTSQHHVVINTLG